MISKVIIGKTFKGCCRYVMNKPGAQILFSSGVREDSVSNTVSDFESIRNLRLGLKKVVLHTSISFAYEDAENLSDEKRVEVAKAFLKKMGLDENQAICVKHTDAKHDHFHIISNRVGFDGKAASDRFIKNRAARSCDELEVEFGLTVARGHGRSTEIKHRSPAKNKVRDEIKQAIESGLAKGIKDFNELERHLANSAIEMKVQYQSTGRVNGLSFRKDGVALKGSAIDKNLSYKKLTLTLSGNPSHISTAIQNYKQPDYER